jgi:hypothetical protein
MESGMAEFRIESDSLGQISVPADDQTLKEAALELGFVDEAKPYVAGQTE